MKPIDPDIFGHFSVPANFTELLTTIGDDALNDWETRLRFQILSWSKDPYYLDRLNEVLAEKSRRSSEYSVRFPGEIGPGSENRDID